VSTIPVLSPDRRSHSQTTQCFNSHCVSNASSLVVDDDLFCNRYGSIRLSLVCGHFGYKKDLVGSFVGSDGMLQHVNAYSQIKKLSDQDLSDITELYTSWRDTDEVVPIKYVYKDYSIINKNDVSTNYASFMMDQFNVRCIDYKSVLFVPKEVNDWRFPKACKRGNPVYITLVKQRFAPLLSQSPITYFDPAYLGVRKRKSKTSMLYITGTVDHEHCGNDRGWLSFGSWWNSFITNLRKQFSEYEIITLKNGRKKRKLKKREKIVYVRAWQSQENGFPHFHALLHFRDREFTVVPWVHPNGKISYRLPSMSSHRSAIKKAWKWGHLDIICVDNTQDAFKDLLKYVTRDLEGGESDLTNAMVWYFRRQSFAISRDFVKQVWGVDESIELAEPTDADLIDANMCNSNLELIRIEIYPTIKADFFKKSHQMTIETWEDPPPISESDYMMLENLVSDHKLVECKRSGKFDCPVFMYVFDGGF